MPLNYLHENKISSWICMFLVASAHLSIWEPWVILKNLTDEQLVILCLWWKSMETWFPLVWSYSVDDCESSPGNWKPPNIHTELKVEITEMEPWCAAACRMLFKRNCMHSFVLCSVHPPIVQWPSVWKTADEQCQIPEVELQMLTTFL